MKNPPKTAVIKCKNCKSKMLVPTDKGTLKVTCPTCRAFFIYEPKKARTMTRSKKKMCCLLLAVVLLSGFAIYSAVQKSKISKAIDVAWYDSIATESEASFLVEISDRTTFSVDKIRKKDGCYIVSIEIEGPDVGKVLNDSKNCGKNKKDVDDYLCQLIKNAPVEKTQTSIIAKRQGAEYSVLFNSEFIDAMSGKLYSLSKNYMFQEIEKE